MTTNAAHRPHTGDTGSLPNSTTNQTLIHLVQSYETAITVPQLAKILQCSKRQVYALIEQKRLPALRVGTMLRLDPGAVADWIKGRMTVAVAA